MEKNQVASSICIIALIAFSLIERLTLVAVE